MELETFDVTPEIPEAAPEAVKLPSFQFQTPSYMQAMEHNLMPKIRFTTDKAEADEAAQADRSDPLRLPDAVFYVGGDTSVDTGEAPGGEKPSASVLEGHSFQNDSFGVDVSTFVKDIGTGGVSGDYAGPSPESINLKIDSDVMHLTIAQENLALAIERGSGVMSAMRMVESAQAVLDADMNLYNEAIKFRAP